tara:strand:+ start:153 stop:1442 length:1290 start_codon:yes stop_codon:yes gene_type:complete
MTSFFANIANLRRACIFTGTNSLAEVLVAFKSLVFGRNYQDQSIITRYESLFAETVGSKYAFSFGSGRMALYAILCALDIANGDEIIVPAFTCVVVPNAMIYRGVTPIYVDIDPKTFNIDVSQIESRITPYTKAIYAQHTFGFPCDIEAIKLIAKKYNLYIIEDAAHSLGGHYFSSDKLPIGSDPDIHATFYTTDHSKVISTYLGGMVTSSNLQLSEKLKTFYKTVPYLDRPRVKKILFSFIIEFIYTHPFLFSIGRYIHSILSRLEILSSFRDELLTTKPTSYPYPCRLSSPQASIGISQLNNLASLINHRNHISSYLNTIFPFYLPSYFSENRFTWLRFSFLTSDRNQFLSQSKSFSDLGIWFTTIFSGREHHLEDVLYEPGSCPVAEYVAAHIVNIPTHSRFLISDAERFNTRFFRDLMLAPAIDD